MIADQPNGALADPLLQFDASGNLQFRYFSGPSPAGGDTVYTEEQIGTQGQAGTETWPLGDNENTPHEVVNNASAVVDHIIANTFGVVTSESAPSVHHWSGFEGGHLDVDTAMIDDYFRWYDPATAKWLSEDPEGFTASDDDLTRYIGNGPTDNIDARGLEYPPQYGPIPGQTPVSSAPPKVTIVGVRPVSEAPPTATIVGVRPVSDAPVAGPIPGQTPVRPKSPQGTLPGNQSQPLPPVPPGPISPSGTAPQSPNFQWWKHLEVEAKKDFFEFQKTSIDVMVIPNEQRTSFLYYNTVTGQAMRQWETHVIGLGVKFGGPIWP